MKNGKQGKKKKIPTKELQYLGARISEARNKSGLTQQELAVQCHRGMRHIQNIEGGLANPSYEVLSDLIHRLGMSANILFFSNMEQVEQEVQHLLCKFAACTEDERQIILNTLDCLSDQFLSRRYTATGEMKWASRNKNLLFLLVLYCNREKANFRQNTGKI